MEDDDNTTTNCKRSSPTESSSSSTSPLFSKKIKLDSPFQKFDLASVISDDFDIHHHHHHHSLFSVSPATSSNSGGFSTTAASRSSSSDSTAALKDTLNSVDPEVKSSVETESSLSSAITNKFRETTSSAMENSKATTVKSSRKIRLPAEKIPCQVEIDEFFAEAEKKEQKRFASKYNYDIAKDSPLEGRYQWVRLKP
ncbi:cyclin-dependent kinase inhibitor 7-like isoform X2 [Mercurialis annua]|uniref:cyclin-dependent kinase inhibitor 7-like isoform X2 n=1 Tax=Mercurialis annua TaxID=3986 RepID=UPI0021608E62|nr:cyclin-dependent kinase inhibitor 7-like isoform X2 [Mercurialis annua]